MTIFCQSAFSPNLYRINLENIKSKNLSQQMIWTIEQLLMKKHFSTYSLLAFKHFFKKSKYNLNIQAYLFCTNPMYIRNVCCIQLSTLSCLTYVISPKNIYITTMANSSATENSVFWVWPIFSNVIHYFGNKNYETETWSRFFTKAR